MAEDPNAEVMAQPEPPPPPAMLDVPDTDSQTDDKFPVENDGTTPEQDLLNFVNYQKYLYFNKFNKLLELIQKTKLAFNNSKVLINFDDIDNEKQHKIINLLIDSLDETTNQINFFLQKGIATVNIDKTRAIFNAIIKKINTIVDTFEGVVKQAEAIEKEKNKYKK